MVEEPGGENGLLDIEGKRLQKGKVNDSQKMGRNEGKCALGPVMLLSFSSL